METTSHPIDVHMITHTLSSVDQKQHFLKRYARQWMFCCLVISDIITLLFASVATLTLWSFVNPALDFSNYIGLWPFLSFFVLGYLLVGLYSIGLSIIDEIRRYALTTSAIFLLLGFISFWSRTSEWYSRASFVISWMLLVVLLPIVRSLIKTVMSRLGLWGEPVVVISFGPSGEQVVKYLLRNPTLGFHPVLFLSIGETSYRRSGLVPTLHVCEPDLKASQWPFQRIHTAFLVTSDMPLNQEKRQLGEMMFNFSRLIMVSNVSHGGSLWVQTCDIGGMLGLEVRQNLLSTIQQTEKRILDLLLVVCLLPLSIPLFGLIMLAIWLDSPGNIFYQQTRIGQYGKNIRVWKFRTMKANAEEELEKHLTKHPDLYSEWITTRKLKNDPRITRIGSVLRRISLDELPQIWNVIKGEMSLVGPRPIVDSEIIYYGDCFPLYLRVKPGMTGIWQVSGRNNVSYEERVRLDEYYVRNWSIWLDVYILFKTIPALITTSGAY